MSVSDKELGAGHPVGFVYCNVGVPKPNKDAGSFLPTFGPYVEGWDVQVRGVSTRVRSNTCSYSGLKRLLVGRECLCTQLEEKKSQEPMPS